MTEKFIGIQVGSHSLFDEGIDHVLDTVQEAAGVNAVFVYSHMYHHGFANGRTLNALAPDHSVPPQDPARRRLPMVWAEPHHQYYAGTVLRHQRNGETEYASRDPLAEVLEPARQRGIQVFARILEGHLPALARMVPNWVKALGIDVYGRLHSLPCWNNPHYRLWWLSTLEDLFKTYDLDGFKYGAERSSPLSTLLLGKGNAYTNDVPSCFCDHCRKKATDKGINFERARQGFQQLFEYIQALKDGSANTVDGVMVSIWRILLRFPEILAWDYFQHQSKEEVAREMYGSIKAIKPDAQVGWHVYHRGTTWDMFYRAAMDYADMAHYADWIKPVIYHDVAGPRIQRDVSGLHETSLRELTEEQILNGLYASMRFNAQLEPEFEQLCTQGLSPDYVFRETKRCVDGVAGRIPVYAGVGFDIPWEGEYFPSNPKRTYDVVCKAFEAGAAGLVISREYDEMRLNNLRAVGDAIRSLP